MRRLLLATAALIALSGLALADEATDRMLEATKKVIEADKKVKAAELLEKGAYFAFEFGEGDPNEAIIAIDITAFTKAMRILAIMEMKEATRAHLVSKALREHSESKGE